MPIRLVWFGPPGAPSIRVPGTAHSVDNATRGHVASTHWCAGSGWFHSWAADKVHVLLVHMLSQGRFPPLNVCTQPASTRYGNSLVCQRASTGAQGNKALKSLTPRPAAATCQPPQFRLHPIALSTGNRQSRWQVFIRPLTCRGTTPKVHPNVYASGPSPGASSTSETCNRLPLCKRPTTLPRPAPTCLPSRPNSAPPPLYTPAPFYAPLPSHILSEYCTAL